MQQLTEGTMRRNKRTGEVQVLQGGQWVPQGGAQPALPTVIEGPPKQPSPQTPAQATGDALGNANTQDTMENRTRTAISNMRDEFQKQQPVKDFVTVLPLLDSALKVGPNKAGDLNLIYAFGKAMDPGSVVREGEQVMATNVGGVSERVKGYLQSINGQGQLTDQQRLELVQEIRRRAHSINLQYNQLRKYYSGLASKNDFDPNDIVGPHPAAPVKQTEGEWFRRVAPEQMEQAQPSTEGDIGFNTPDQPRSMSPEQESAYNTFLRSNPQATPEQLVQFTGMIGAGDLDPARAKEIIDYYRQTGEFAPGSAAVYKLPPELQQRVDERLQNTGAGGAAIAGGADTVTMGTFDELSALGDAFGDALDGKGFNFSGNLEANRQFQRGLEEQSGGAYLGGQLAGGLLLPTFGAGTAADLAKVGAGYGAAYGAGSGEGVQGRGVNALLGAATGAGTGYLLGRGSELLRARRGPQEVPPLVDPATGELNQPLDAMRPSGRVQAMRDVGIETITPGMAGGRSARVLEQGFNNLPGSAGHMEDVNSAVSGEVRRAMQGTAQKFGSSKTLSEGGSELQRGANEYISRVGEVTGKAYDAIPISGDAPASVAATTATLESLTQKFSSNPELAKQMNSPKIQQMLEAIKGKGLSWQDLKALRTSIGERIGERRFTDDTATSDLRAVYAALTDDMKNTAAAMGPKAIRAFERANNLYRDTQQIIDKSLVSILGNDAAKSPEKAAAAIQAMTLGGKSTGDLKKLAQIRAATIKSGAWDEIASTLIHLGGQPANSTGRAFQPDTFVRWYADMAEPARAMLFKPELRKELEKFVAVNQQLSRLKGLNNTSQTAPVMFGGSALLTAASALVNPLLGVKMGGVLAANYAMGKLWTSPAFVRLATGYTRAMASGNQNAVKSQVGRLSKLATTNPELREGIQQVLRSIANDNAPTPGVVAASPNEGPEQQGQPQQ